jgi:hypothetical protein
MPKRLMQTSRFNFGVRDQNIKFKLASYTRLRGNS